MYLSMLVTYGNYFMCCVCVSSQKALCRVINANRSITASSEGAPISFKSTMLTDDKSNFH